jgi:WD40 repeat protein
MVTISNAHLNGSSSGGSTDKRKLSRDTSSRSLEKQVVKTMAWSKLNEFTLASSTNNNDISIWDIRQTSTPLSLMYGHDRAITALEWSPGRDNLLLQPCDFSYDRHFDCYLTAASFSFPSCFFPFCLFVGYFGDHHKIA